MLSIAELEERLRHAEETLRAIRSGEVDALVVSGPNGDQVYTLQGADHPYRLLVEQMDEGTVTLDAQGIILYANPRFAGMVNTPLEAVVGAPMSSFVPAEHASSFSAMMDGTCNHGRAEMTMCAAGGAPIPVQISTSGLDLHGTRLVCAVITDLTAQRRNESIVRDERLSRLILEQAAEAIIVIDPAGLILRASESAQKLAGQNALFQPFDAVFPLLRVGSREAYFDSGSILRSVRRGEPLRGVEVRFARGARISELLLSAGPVWDDRHELLACVLTLTDFTFIKETERELERRKRELEQSNNELQQFAYSASHDLREPLRIVTVYSQLLQKKYGGQLDSQAQGYIGQTIEAAQRMEKLLRDLLEYMQSGEAPRALQSPVDANVVLRKVLTSLNTAIMEARAIVTHDSLPVIRVYEAHLQQLLQNLISNAIKYRGEAPCRVHISAQRDDSMWRFSVQDNGIGIAPQYHQQVFGLFKRLHGGAQYRGSGIGLAICQKIVDRYGGRIWVESALGHGATFHFTLPAEFL